MTSLLALIIGLLRAIPAVESILRMAFLEIDRQREAEALRRKHEKDAAVDSALGGVRDPEV